MNRTDFPRFRADFNWLDMPLFPGGGFSVLDQPVQLAVHQHQWHEFAFVQSGQVRWEVEGNPILHLLPGHMALIQPATLHRGEFNIVRPSKIMWLFVDCNATNATRYTPFDSSAVLDIHNRLSAAGNKVGPSPAEMHRLSEDFLVVSKQHSNRNDKLDFWRGRTMACDMLLCGLRALADAEAPSMNSTIAGLREAMDANPADTHRVQKLAKDAGLSKSRFTELFRREVGQSPMDYLNRLKCKKAADLLEDKKNSVSEVAATLGFSSSQYFANCFRRYLGVSPSNYRRRCETNRGTKK